MKLKTNKAMSKRVKVTRTGKLLKRKAGQGHFNSRDTGKNTRRKRRDVTLGNTLREAVNVLMPHA